MQELISVVIPVYMVESYLPKCIKSIQNQTYTNIEIILVDDGSKDNCGKMCDEYAKQDNRIKVIHQENGGLSNARNTGITLARGKYITFIDSDDYISDDYITYLYEMIKINKVKISVCGIKRFYDNKSYTARKHSKYKILTRDEAYQNLLYAQGIDVAAYAKMYQTDLFANIRYPEKKVYEDTATTYLLFEEVDKIAYGDKECYFYYTRAGSISKEKGFNPKEYDYIEHTTRMLDFLEEKYPQLQKAVNRYRIYADFRILRMLVCYDNKEKELEERLIKEIQQLKWGVMKDRNTPKRDIIAIIAITMGRSIFKTFWYIYSKITGRII